MKIVWRSNTATEDTQIRNAIVVTSAGHLLMAGPKPDFRRGTLYATFADGNTVRASYVASDTVTALTILHVNYRDLTPLRFRTAPLTAGAQPVKPALEPPPTAPVPANPTAPSAVPDKDAAGAARRAPLPTLPVGLSVMMVTGTNAAARGAIRAVDRRIPVFHAEQLGTPTPVSGLVEAGLAAVPSDQGSPWIDEDGAVVALQLATGFAESLPEPKANGMPRGLRSRITPSASLAIPASVLRIVTPNLIARRQVPRGALGLTTRRCSETYRQHFAKGGGCHVVLEVDTQGPAGTAGIRPQDVIIEIEGRPLRPLARLVDLMLPYRPGEQVRFTLLRKGKRVEVELTLSRK